MNSVENYWEEQSNRIGEYQKKLDRDSLKHRDELAADHKQGCKCSYCDPVEDDMLDMTRPAEHPIDTNAYCKHLVSHYQEVPSNAEVYDGLEGEELEEFMKRVKAEDEVKRKLPPMKHPDIVDEKKLGEALSKYYNFIEAKKTELDQPPLEGLLIFYVEVGQLPTEKAEAFVERMKDRVFKELNDRLPNTWKTIWLPTREQGGTTVEAIRFNG